MVKGPPSIRRANCRACHSSDLSCFLDLGDMPLAGGFLANREAFKSEQTFPLPVHICEKCGLVQILEVINPEILFQDYSFSSSTIAPLVSHFQSYAKWIKERIGPKSVLEFGCNDGVLLKPLTDLGIKAVGVDISKNITEIARANNLAVETGYFNEELAEEIVKKYGKFDVVSGSNAFAHNDSPEAILAAARKILSPTGKLCLEFMYLGDLWDTCQWDTFYHEHLTFYCLQTVSKLLKDNGFYVFDAERIPMHGGALRVSASLDSNVNLTDSAIAVLKYEGDFKLAHPETWKNFGSLVDRKIGIVRDTLGRLQKNSRVWGYGAAGKATLWVNACKMNYLEAMVDASPLRAGKFMPGTHTPIVFPEELKKNPPEYIFVTAWNYADHIKAKESWYNGQWVTPLLDLRFF